MPTGEKSSTATSSLPNLLMDREGRVFLTDFGIARQANEPNRTTTVNQPGHIPLHGPRAISQSTGNHSVETVRLAMLTPWA